MRARLSVYSDRMAYERLSDFVQNCMRMSHVFSRSCSCNSASEDNRRPCARRRMKAGKATRMTVVVVLTFACAVVGYASPQEQALPGAAGGRTRRSPPGKRGGRE